MNRRDFLKSALAGAIGLSLPIELAASVTIVDIKLADSFSDTIKMGRPYLKDGQAFVDATIATDDIFKYVILVDEDDNEWITDDQGITWRSGMMAITIGESETDAA